MNQLRWSSLRSVLCIGAHADDIEIGCGGTLLQAIAAQPDLEVVWVVFSASDSRRAEALASSHEFLAGCRSARVEIESFQDAFFPAQWEALKRRLGEISRSVNPDLVFTHRLEDRHQDHRVLAELTWNAFRDHAILEYEIPKYEGDLTTPNFYVPLTAAAADQKLALLERHFATQAVKDWYDRETFEGLLRLRGLECRAASRRAEAFVARKMVASWPA